MTKETKVVEKTELELKLEKDLKKKERELKKAQKQADEAVKQAEETKKQLAEFEQKFNAFLEAQPSKETTEKVVEKVVVREEAPKKKKLYRDDEVIVRSLVPYPVCLRTSSNFANIKFEDSFEYQEVTVEHLKDAWNTAKSLFKNGTVYIESEEFVKQNGLSKYYEKFSTPEDLKNFSDTPIDKIQEKYLALPEGQQNMINQMVYMAFAYGEEINKSFAYEVDTAFKIANKIPDIHARERGLIAMAEKQKLAMQIRKEFQEKQ